MIDARFSAAAFQARGLDEAAAKEVADLLAQEVLRELYNAALPALAEIIRKLNEMGHALVPYGKASPGECAYRDDRVDDSGVYHCKLRVAYNMIVSTGYSHLLRSPPYDE